MPKSARIPFRAGVLGCALVAGATASAQPLEDSRDPALSPTEPMPRAERSLLLGAVRAEGGYLAVGERGHVLRSTDGIEWRQVEAVPSRSTLTAIAAVGEALWAVGHDGIVLHSADGGQTWERQRADPRPADSTDPDQGRPLLDVLFADERRGWAVGAYALMLETADGGLTWRGREIAVPGDGRSDPDGVEQGADGDVDADGSWLFDDSELELEAEENPHFNAIARTPGGRLIVAGERGAAYRSLDDGVSWERLSLPYEGSMFGVLTWGEEHVLMFGLRGRILESFDFGASWRLIENGIEASLMGGHGLDDGGAVLVGAEGRVVVRRSAEAPFSATTFANEEGETPVLADALPLAGDEFLVIGERGIGRHRVE